MNFLDELKKIMKNDNSHIMEIKISFSGLLVKLFYDPQKKFGERFMLPIYYDAVENFSYIPVDLIKEEYNGDYGFEYDEINLANKIMKCMENNRDEIEALCNVCDFDYRNEKPKSVNEEG